MDITVLVRKLDIVNRIELQGQLEKACSLAPEWQFSRGYGLRDTYRLDLLMTNRIAFGEDGQLFMDGVEGLLAVPPAGGDPAQAASPSAVAYPHRHFDGWRLSPLGGLSIAGQGFLCRNAAQKGVARVWFFEVSGVRTTELVFFQALRGYEAESQAMKDLISAGAGTLAVGPLNELIAMVLGIHLPAAPVRRGGMRTEVTRILQERLSATLRQARQYERGIIADLDPECLHQYRVGYRQVRSLANIFKTSFSGQGTELKQLLGGLMEKTNRLRDLDVLLDSQAEYQKMVDSRHRPGIDGLFRHFMAERLSEFHQVTAWMSSEDFGRQAARSILLLEPHSPVWCHPVEREPIGAAMRQRLVKTYRKIYGATGMLGPDCASHELHALRIQHKRLRYLLEFYLDLEPDDDVECLLSLLKASQKHLGNYNDAEVQAEWLRQWGARHAGRLPLPERAALDALAEAFASHVAAARNQALRHVRECLGDDARGLVGRIAGRPVQLAEKGEET
jgi:CHAD domain-containing protein